MTAGREGHGRERRGSVTATLPIDAVRSEVLAAVGRAPVVVTAPTGSGKSTQVPRWCLSRGSVLVVEPRRVACRALATHVASLEAGSASRGAGAPGGRVGYRVRDEDVSGAETQLLFVTPGVALRMVADDPGLSRWDTVWLDEVHERTLDVDLLLALLQRDRPDGLGVMSATVAGERFARHLGGVHVQGEGRTFPVTTRYADQCDALPRDDRLAGRVAQAVANTAQDPGDVLVFLPGKREIGACAAALAGDPSLHVVQLHGGLSLSEQGRVFTRSRRRKVVLTTNVAETSLTIDGIGVVIDSGLVRQQRWHGGHSYLTTASIADDSAAQRAGRAGRTAPGVCLRLWSGHVRLRSSTPPEIHRLSLVPLVLAAAAAGYGVDALPWLDPPKPDAVDRATQDLRALGALAATAGLTERGRRLFRLPVDAWHGRLLVEGERSGDPWLAVDLVAALSIRGRLFVGPRPEDPDDDLRAAGDDGVALVRAVREGDAQRHGLHPGALRDARQQASRLGRLLGLPRRRPPTLPTPTSRDIVRLALAADPRCAYVQRGRGRKSAWGNGREEMGLGRGSVIDEGDTAWVVALALRGVSGGERGAGRGAARLVCEVASPARVAWLSAAGVGTLVVAAPKLVKGVIRCRAERQHAGQVLGEELTNPEGADARDAALELMLRGRLDRDLAATLTERLEAGGLYLRLLDAGAETADGAWLLDPFWSSWRGPSEPRAWLAQTLEALGFDSGDDWPLLSVDDVCPPPLPERVQQRLNHAWPRTLVGAGARYRIDYDLSRSRATLVRLDKGRRCEPPRQLLPRLDGFRIDLLERGRRVRLR